MPHVLRIALGVAVVTGLMLLPYLPGRYDGWAVGLSVTAQMASFASLLLVPVGAAWMAYEGRRSRAGGARATGAGARRAFAIAACIAAVPVAAAALAGAGSVGRSLAAALLVVAVYAATWLARRLRRPDFLAAPGFHPLPTVLVVVPLACLAARRWLLVPAADAARVRAMRNAAPLIAEIEAHRSEHAHHPPNLAALWSDFATGVIGVERYHYVPRHGGYALYFEAPSLIPGTREIVMYDAADAHALPSHDTDLLRWSDEQRAARPGHHALADTSEAHWKVFSFD